MQTANKIIIIHNVGFFSVLNICNENVTMRGVQRSFGRSLLVYRPARHSERLNCIVARSIGLYDSYSSCPCLNAIKDRPFFELTLVITILVISLTLCSA